MRNVAPEIAYGRAREITRELLGREHMVARAILYILFKKLKSLHDDADSLSRLSINLQNCHVALSQMNHTGNMTLVSTIERILRTLSNDARQSWARLTDSMDKLGKQIGFSDLCNFVVQEARIARSRYGMLTIDSEQHRPQTRHHRVGNERRHSLFAVQTLTDDSCPFCDRRHGLAQCRGFTDLPMQATWRVVRRKRLWQHGGHASNECDSPKKCGIERCLWSSHHLLHVVPDANKTKLVGLCNSTSQTESGTCLGVVPTVSGTFTVEAACLRIEFESADSGKTVAAEQAFAIRSLPISPPVISPTEIAGQYNHLKDTTFFGASK
ncbi:hypothetical protein T265_07095 [Opisthorchis viverrini]|uniref:Uncharacterized protein n=1 Tax=Opisthorchis viverrini TaxID=6198 RepID=A0A074ZQ63_OPIVI|nr:hypothetical protein T265_07095 [Opisthorchis viverrini]KER25475.1 hypothetical protein T265_07095 [Opisthorchis viverrini]